jgi:hypothetical protein
VVNGTLRRQQRFAALTQIAARERVERHRKTPCDSCAYGVGLDQVLSQFLDLDVLCVGRWRMIGIDDSAVRIDISVSVPASRRARRRNSQASPTPTPNSWMPWLLL